MQDNLRLSRDEIIICYKDDVARLMQYLSWLQEKSGTVATDILNKCTHNFYSENPSALLP